MKKSLILSLFLLAALGLVLAPALSQAAPPPAGGLFRLLYTPTPATPLQGSLVSTPASGTAPLTVTLTARETSTNTGQFSFYFWCNKNTSDTSTSGADKKVELTTGKVQTHTCTYSSAGSYTPKVVIAKANLSSIERRVTVAVTAAPPAPVGPGGEIIFEKDGQPITVKGSLVADKITFNPRQKSSNTQYAAMIYSDAKVLYAALPGFETLVNVMIQ